MDQETKQQTNRAIGKVYHSEKAKAKLKKSGVIFPSLPNIPAIYQDEDGAFKMPNDITDIDPRELGRLFSLLTGLTAYYEAITSLSFIDRDTAARVRDYTEAQVMLELDMSDPVIKKKYPNRELQDAYVNTDPRVVDAQDWYDGLATTCVLAETICKGYDRYLFLVSREISRRGQFGQHESRETNLY